MINRPVVLILGAGASMHLGYPPGIGLVKEICSALDGQDNEQFRKLTEIGFFSGDISTFRDNLYFSAANSVDAFLEHRPELLDIGKVAIAQELIRHESQERLFDFHQNWYRLLFEKMNAPLESFSGNSVTFITFNYDRSLEQFLFTALKNSYGKPDVITRDVLNNIPIIHLHGKLGLLPWEGNNGRAYGEMKSDAELKKSGKLIKIIHEGTENDPEFLSAIRSINNAEHVLFLGFGYDKTNLERLGLTERWQGDARFLGTAFETTDKERDEVREIFPHVELYTWDIVSFLGEVAPF